MQFLTFGAHVIHELVQHVPSHPLPCASPCTAEGPHSARLLFRYCSLSPAPLHPLHSQQNMLMRARPSSTDAVASARGHLPAPRLQGSAKARKTPLRTPVRCPSRLLSPGRCRARRCRQRACQWNTPTLGSEPRPPPTAPCHAESCSLAVGTQTELSVRPRRPNDISLSKTACR